MTDPHRAPEFLPLRAWDLARPTRAGRPVHFRSKTMALYWYDKGWHHDRSGLVRVRRRGRGEDTFEVRQAIRDSRLGFGYGGGRRTILGRTNSGPI